MSDAMSDAWRADYRAKRHRAGVGLMRTTWTTRERTTLTFSLRNAHDARAAALIAAEAADACGYGSTLSPRAIGTREGATEDSYTLAMVGPIRATALDAIVGVLANVGCEAVQLEQWNGEGYECREVRA